MNSVSLKYRPHLDGLRGVAVLAVVGFHCFPRFVPGGFIGVDIFFVISGFLISSILYADFRAPASELGSVIRNFYSRRIRRIFPALILVLISCGLLGYFLLIPAELEKLSGHVVASAGFCLNLVLSGQEDYFNAGGNSTPLLHLWSLGIEEQFYLLWPLVIWGALRCRMKILPLAAFLAAFSFFWNAQKFSGTETAAFYLPQNPLWELLLGSIAAVIAPLIPEKAIGGKDAPPLPFGAMRRHIAGSNLANVLSLLGLGLIGTGFIVINAADFRLPDQWTLLPTFGAACVVCSDGSAWLNRHILSRKILVWVGLISYPLYLWHWPLLAFAHISNSAPDSPGLRGGLLLLSFLLAWLTYRFVENPVRQGRKFSRAATVGALAGAMIALAAIGAYARNQGGFPGRFPPLMNEIFAFKYDPAAALRQGRYFLSGDQNENNFARDPQEIVPGKPTLFLWGDSHAAALYAGLRDADGARFNIVQRTTARTPPFLPGYFNPGNAQDINRYVLNEIKREQPEYVLLEADWETYAWNNVAGTIAALQAAGIRHVVLIGPVPKWFGSLPQQLFNYLRIHHNSTVPFRMRLGADPEPARVDRHMAELSRQAGAEYISPCQILESPDGYLVRTGETADSLVTYDNSHLTVRGSDYVVAHFPRL